MEEGLLIVGLGNPGPRYSGNRHNFGFMVLDELRRKVAPEANWQEKFSGLFCSSRVNDRRVDLLKPLTYMNLSGRAVAKVLQFYQYPIENLVVIHDDVDLPFGSLRVKKGGGTGGHKGLASMQNCLQSSDFVRIRMGIGRPAIPDESGITNHVLENFSLDERLTLLEIVEKGVEAAKCLIEFGTTVAMNKFNKRERAEDES